MSMTVGYKPYTGAINTNSARYKRAKAMYDEGHTNGDQVCCRSKGGTRFAKPENVKANAWAKI